MGNCCSKAEVAPRNPSQSRHVDNRSPSNSSTEVYPDTSVSFSVSFTNGDASGLSFQPGSAPPTPWDSDRKMSLEPVVGKATFSEVVEELPSPRAFFRLDANVVTVAVSANSFATGDGAEGWNPLAPPPSTSHYETTESSQSSQENTDSRLGIRTTVQQRLSSLDLGRGGIHLQPTGASGSAEIPSLLNLVSDSLSLSRSDRSERNFGLMPTANAFPTGTAGMGSYTVRLAINLATADNRASINGNRFQNSPSSIAATVPRGDMFPQSSSLAAKSACTLAEVKRCLRGGFTDAQGYYYPLPKERYKFLHSELKELTESDIGPASLARWTSSFCPGRGLLWTLPGQQGGLPAPLGKFGDPERTIQFLQLNAECRQATLELILRVDKVLQSAPQDLARDRITPTTLRRMITVTNELYLASLSDSIPFPRLRVLLHQLLVTQSELLVMMDDPTYYLDCFTSFYRLIGSTSTSAQLAGFESTDPLPRFRLPPAVAVATTPTADLRRNPSIFSVSTFSTESDEALPHQENAELLDELFQCGAEETILAPEDGNTFESRNAEVSLPHDLWNAVDSALQPFPWPLKALYQMLLLQKVSVAQYVLLMIGNTTRVARADLLLE